MEVPEAGNQKQEDEDAGILKPRDLAGGELDVFAASLFGRHFGLAIDFRTDNWRVHGDGGYSLLRVYQEAGLRRGERHGDTGTRRSDLRCRPS